MDLHNRWGEKVSPESSGLIGPDGKPIPVSCEEKPSQEQDPPEAGQEPQLDFFNYIASLGFQAMIFLGEIPNPLTNQIDRNLKQAKFLIDTMTIIREKTTGNLTKEESELLHGSIYELQLRYVEAVKKEQAPS
ncbi:MAG: DUF1844 domain-containing protein [Candidatus Omnitrophica bacterium]|nr:DUF1844 domain-containing protein [Candidatus Omnitrophota bacterium]